MLFRLALQSALFSGLFALAQSPLPLVSAPLAVKTPYFNAWNPGLSLQNVWPTFYIFSNHLTWAGYVRVDNTPYQWLGDDFDSLGANYSSTLTVEITPTKSVFRIASGPIQFNVTFLTPIEPNDYVRQSMPFSYMYIDGFSANDSQPHNVQIYSDITAEWVTADASNIVVWDTTEDDDIVYHNVTRQDPLPMVDNDNFAEDGIAYYAMLKRPGLTWQTCGYSDCRPWFSKTGSLNNTKDTDFRAVNDGYPVYAFSVDLGTILPGSQPDPVVSALGLVRDPIVAYTTEQSVQNRVGYYFTEYATPGAAITAFLQDFVDAQNRSSQLDDKVMIPATQISTEYAGILAFVTRQLFASIDITVPSDSNGSFNTSDVKIFMKDMGRSRRANPVDVIYGAFSAFLFFNSSIAADLIIPLLETQSSPDYRNPYAAPDLGSGYPTVVGNFTNTETLGVDSSGSMLIMTYAHAVKSGDGSLLERYYTTLQTWADYLVTNALHPPSGSVTADNMNSVSLSNEALKGILGVYCMGKINEALGVANTTYSDQAIQLIKNWQQLAISENHITTVFGEGSSWGLIYNLFPAIWLNTGLIGDDIINNQAQFYSQQSAEKFGFVLDSTQPDVTYPHWTMWTAATIPSNLTSIRDQLVGFVYGRITDISQNSSLPMDYQVSTGAGDPNGLAGSAIHGAAFGILALNLQNVDINVNGTKLGNFSNSTNADNNAAATNIGAIVGGVIGGVVGTAILIFVPVFLWRRNRQHPEGNLSSERPRPFDLSKYNGYSTVNNNDNIQLTTNVTAGRGRSSQAQVAQRQGVSDVGADPWMTSKQREALGIIPRHTPGPSESAVSTSTNQNSMSGSETVANELRVEVEQLRREISTLRHITVNPPPGYT